MSIDSIKRLFIREIRDLHGTEQRLLETLPDMIDRTTDPLLRIALEDHLGVTREHRDRLVDIAAGMAFEIAGAGEGTRALLEDAARLVSEIDDPALRDLAIAAAIRRLEHHEIAGYGTAVSYAHSMGEEHAADLLDKTLGEEKKAATELANLTTTWLNSRS